MKVCAHKAKAWAVGTKRSNGFYPRRVVWGRLMAQYEKREGEKIVRVRIVIEERKT